MSGVNLCKYHGEKNVGAVPDDTMCEKLIPAVNGAH